MFGFRKVRAYSVVLDGRSPASTTGDESASSGITMREPQPYDGDDEITIRVEEDGGKDITES